MSLFDLAMHSTHAKATVEERLALYKEMSSKHSVIPMTEGINPYASWAHLIAGYNAGYYSYLWSEVVAIHLYMYFKEQGLLNDEVGYKLRKTILEPCASIPATEMIKNFLGTPFSIDPYLKKHNVI